jgi:hypothetical protein
MLDDSCIDLLGHIE